MGLTRYWFFLGKKLFPVCVTCAALVLCPVFPEEAPAEDDFLDLSLWEDEGITVVGTIESTQQMRTISREEIEEAHAPDTASLLQESLGLGLTRRGPYGNETDINLRGFDTERVAVLIDGIPVNSSRTGGFDFTTISPDSIERIEVIYGGSDTKYNVSGALGGVINIVTVKKQEKGIRFGGGISNTSAMPGKYYNRDGSLEEPRWRDLADTQNLSLFAGLGAEKFSWSANWFGNRAANHYLFTASDNSRRRREYNEVYDTGFNTSFVWDLPEYTKLILSGDIYYGDKNFPITGGSAGTYGDWRDFSTRQNIMLDMPRIFRDDLAAEASLSHSWQTLDYESPSEDSLHKESALTAINRWSWYLLESLTLRIGGDYRYTSIDSTNDGLRHGHDGGLYLTAEYGPHKKILLIPSVKMVFRNTIAAAVPKFGIVWHAAESFTLKNNYYRSFKFPDFDALYWSQSGNYGNPDLKNEDGWGGDLVAEYRWKKWVRLESAFFAQWIENSIHWSNTSGIWRPENVAEAVFFGWDSRLRFEIPLPFKQVEKLIPSVSYNYLLSYVLTGRTGYRFGFSGDIRIPYAPLHTLGASLEIPWQTGSFLISCRYEGLRYNDYVATPAATMNTGKLEPTFLLNINVNQEINKNLSAFAVLRNILNKSYQSFYDYHMPGLTVTLGMAMKIQSGE
ncbi:MAG: TonB-dependent receptor, partial [Treponema sp.]|nr:TonB-dependent receptor [Treponema sp.]